MAGRLLEAIETYAAAVRRAERAGINASLCQTRRDYAEAHECDAAECEARTALERAIEEHTEHHIAQRRRARRGA